jgi:hypothetical protein
MSSCCGGYAGMVLALPSRPGPVAPSTRRCRRPIKRHGCRAVESRLTAGGTRPEGVGIPVGVGVDAIRSNFCRSVADVGSGDPSFAARCGSHPMGLATNGILSPERWDALTLLLLARSGGESPRAVAKPPLRCPSTSGRTVRRRQSAKSAPPAPAQVIRYHACRYTELFCDGGSKPS